MATYAVGDIQGCYDSLRYLLDTLSFNPEKDTLWVAGDLVNRGPDSLSTLRFLKSLGKACNAVLGNHDLHLLGVDVGVRKLKKKDTLDAILAAPDKEELLDWLRSRPFLHHCPEQKITMVHAGIPLYGRSIRLKHKPDYLPRRCRRMIITPLLPHCLKRTSLSYGVKTLVVKRSCV